MSQLTREEEARDARIDAMPLHGMAKTYARRAMEWLNEHRGTEIAAGDLVMREALDVVAWGAFLVGAKLHRALGGRDRAQYDEEDCDDDPCKTTGTGPPRLR